MPPRANAEEYLRILFEQSRDGVFVANADGVCVEVNRAGHRLLGHDWPELIGRRIADIVMPSDLSRLASVIERLGRSEPAPEEWVLRSKTGVPIETELTAHRLADGSLFAVVRDLRPRRLIEQKARASEAELRSILETAPDIIMAVDREGTIEFINRTIPPLTPDEVVRTSCFNYVPESARARVRAALDKVFNERAMDEYEVQYAVGPEDLSYWSGVRAGPLIEDGEVVAAILCASDITARRQDEHRIRELVSRLQRVSSQLPGFVYQYRVRPDGWASMPYASERIRDLLRLSPEDVRNDVAPLVARIHPEDREQVASVIRTARMTLTAANVEFRVLQPDGELRWMHANALVSREPDGSVLFSGYTHDITARKEDERQKGLLEEQLRESQKLETIGRLAGGVAHDFNNLLTAILGFVDLARAEVPSDSQAADYLVSVTESAERGAALTEQLLAFARRKLVRPEVVDLNAVLSRMGTMLRRIVGEQLELVLLPEAGLGRVKVDVGSLEQVIMNLVLNARDAIAGPGRITLETESVSLDDQYSRGHLEVAPGRYARLIVMDTGSGMAPEVRQRVFEPFFTTKPVGKGTGLGLAMCEGIVRQAGGHITVVSEPGKGSTFSVYLPFVQGTQDRPEASADPQERAGASTRGHETLLIVEDEPLILRMASTALSALGYRVLTASDGLRALELVRATTEPIDLLISDVVMPSMSGLELGRQLAAIRPGLRMLFSSGYTEDTIVADGVLDPAINFLEKPYSFAALVMRVRALLDA